MGTGGLVKAQEVRVIARRNRGSLATGHMAHGPGEPIAECGRKGEGEMRQGGVAGRCGRYHRMITGMSKVSAEVTNHMLSMRGRQCRNYFIT